MDITTHPDGSITLTVPAAYAATTALDAPRILDWTASALIALARLRDRDPEVTVTDWSHLLGDVGGHLLPRIEGIVDALIRAHAAKRGSYGDLASALGAPRSTAQGQRDRLLASDPDQWERWATTPHSSPTDPPPPPLTIAELERDLLAAQGDPQRHAEVRSAIRLAGYPHLAAELDRIAADAQPSTRSVVAGELAGWSATLTVRNPESGAVGTVQLDGLTDDQATEVETLINSDPNHTVTIQQPNVARWVFRAAEVQVVRVERTHTTPTA